MRPPRMAGLVVCLGLLAAVVLPGCSTKKTLVAKLPPHTQLFVKFNPADGDSHTVNNVAHLYWVGSDPDGFVVGYDVRLKWPPDTAFTPWTRTLRTDSILVVPDTTGYSAPIFEVRAVDNDGLVDPSPPQQSFRFSNLAPEVTILFAPNQTDTTFATQTIDWLGVDPDGDAGLMSYRVWLDGNEANPHFTNSTEFTFPTSDFRQNGALLTGPRTAYVQAIDAGGRLSNVASATWQVLAPVPNTAQPAHLLVIDDVRSTVFGGEPGGPVYQTFFDNAIARSGIPAGSFRILELGTGRPFRSSKDLEQSFKLFDAVVWYRGKLPFGGTPFDINRDTLLTLHSDAIGAYLDGGGKFYIESADLIDVPADNGLFSDAFMKRYLGSDFVFKKFVSPDSSASWDYATAVGGIPAWLHSTVFNDSLHFAQGGGGIRVFAPRDTNDVVLWARPGTLEVGQTFDGAVAMRSTTPAGGKVVVSSLPVLIAGGQVGGGRFIDRLFLYLGIKP